jgi:KamA family protein
MSRYRYLTNLGDLAHVQQLPAERRRRLESVARRYRFRSNEYYQSLIDWNDPDDPIRRIVMPHETELQDWGLLDASGESTYIRAPGLEHKYRHTAILLVNDVCGALCRFCFRKRLFMADNEEVTRDITPALDYLSAHVEIDNVLITGGDPLLLSTPRLQNILDQLLAIPHLRMLRIGSKMAAFNPYRILDDPELLAMLAAASQPERRLYFMAHFNHPRELTAPARESIRRLQAAGLIVLNQTPLLHGVNDHPDTLSSLCRILAALGVTPYYLFQCRPTAGNASFAVPIEQGFQTFAAAQSRGSGLVRRLRYVMSHHSGKIEILGLDAGRIYLRYHRAAHPGDEGRMLFFPRNPKAYWLDDYTTASTDHAPRMAAHAGHPA